jgi:RNA polymerase sigma-70 factor (ECF subfamily)
MICGPPSSRAQTCKQRTAEQDLLREARLEEVRQAVAMLPAKQRAAVLMHKYEEMSQTPPAKRVA